MTGRTAPAAGAPAQHVNRAIEAVARRMLAVRFVQHGYWWVAGGTAAAAVTAVARSRSLAEAVLWLMGALVGSLGLAWCTARHHRPDAAAAARTIDTQLGLRGLVSAARELSGEPDVVSALIVRDAAVRVEGLAAERLVPFRGPGRRAASGLAIAAVVWLTAVSLPGGPVPLAGPDVGASGGAGGLTSLRPATGATPDEANLVDGAPPPGATDAGSRRPDTAAERSASATGSDRPQTDAAQAADTPTAETATAAGTEPGSASAASLGRGGAGEGAGGRRGGGDGPAPRGNQALARAGGRTDNLTGAASGQGRGSAAESSAAASGRGGGVSGERALADTPATLADGSRPGAGQDAARYRAARARAESPAGQARIPPDMRRLVRNYFIAIGPGAPE